MGWGEGTVHLDASGLYPGARMYALSEGSATLKYAQIVAWLDLQRLVPPLLSIYPKALKYTIQRKAS